MLQVSTQITTTSNVSSYAEYLLTGKYPKDEQEEQIVRYGNNVIVSNLKKYLLEDKNDPRSLMPPECDAFMTMCHSNSCLSDLLFRIIDAILILCHEKDSDKVISMNRLGFILKSTLACMFEQKLRIKYNNITITTRPIQDYDKIVNPTQRICSGIFVVTLKYIIRDICKTDRKPSIRMKQLLPYTDVKFCDFDKKIIFSTKAVLIFLNTDDRFDFDTVLGIMHKITYEINSLFEKEPTQTTKLRKDVSDIQESITEQLKAFKEGYIENPYEIDVVTSPTYLAIYHSNMEMYSRIAMHCCDYMLSIVAREVGFALE